MRARRHLPGGRRVERTGTDRAAMCGGGWPQRRASSTVRARAAAAERVRDATAPSETAEVAPSETAETPSERSESWWRVRDATGPETSERASIPWSGCSGHQTGSSGTTRPASSTISSGSRKASRPLSRVRIDCQASSSGVDLSNAVETTVVKSSSKIAWKHTVIFPVARLRTSGAREE